MRLKGEGDDKGERLCLLPVIQPVHCTANVPLLCLQLLCDSCVVHSGHTALNKLRTDQRELRILQRCRAYWRLGG